MHIPPIHSPLMVLGRYLAHCISFPFWYRLLINKIAWANQLIVNPASKPK